MMMGLVLGWKVPGARAPSDRRRLYQLGLWLPWGQPEKHRAAPARQVRVEGLHISIDLLEQKWYKFAVAGSARPICATPTRTGPGQEKDFMR
jgi:hypothetical protein